MLEVMAYFILKTSAVYILQKFPRFQIRPLRDSLHDEAVRFFLAFGTYCWPIHYNASMVSKEHKGFLEHFLCFFICLTDLLPFLFIFYFASA